MFEKKTVFIIGAGCSREYGLPLGDSLKDEITALLWGAKESRTPRRDSDFAFVSSQGQDSQFIEAINVASGKDFRGYRVCMEQMIEGVGHATSIDRYLDINRDEPRIVQMGKLAITRAILRAESRSSLTIGSSGHLNTAAIKKATDPHWLGQLFERLMDSGIGRSDLSTAFKSISFICFNYDRCIEHYLVHALRAVARFDEAEAAGIVGDLRILHPYGQVGRLDWQKGEGPVAAFGADIPDPNALLTLSNGIKLYTEQADSAVVGQIHEKIATAEQIVFMGFSFLKQNMKLLTPPSKSSVQAVYGTAYNESQQNVSVAKAMIGRLLSGDGLEPSYSGSIDLHGLTIMTAGGFMRSYGNLLRG